MTKIMKSIKLMGTSIDIMVDHPRSQDIIQEVIEQLIIYENRFSANNEHSELSQVNLNAGIKPIPVHPELYQLIKVGKLHSLANNSLLNITIGPLVQLWRIGFIDAKLPNQVTINNLLPLLNPEKIILNDVESTVFLSEKYMKLDLGALAKGYIGDRIKEYLISMNVKQALLNLGGNLITIGEAYHQADKHWKIGIQNPGEERGQNILVLKTKATSIVTSGIYERVLKTSDGKEFHHILDSQIGYPTITKIASLTIISPLSLDGEIWTTRLFGSSPEEIISIINNLEGIECIIILVDKQLFYSRGLENMINLC